jgi:hypothetical protein
VEEKDVQAAKTKPDYLNYDPFKERTRQGNYPRRKRVPPLKHWAGEQPLYKIRGKSRIPEIAGYGRDEEVVKYSRK